MIDNAYDPNNYFIPLCNYDIKYKHINIYGYYFDKKSIKYNYKRICVYNDDLNKVINTSYIKIRFRRIISTKIKTSLCIVTIYKNINIENLLRTCLLYRRLGVEHITLYISYYNMTYKKYYKWLKSRYWIEIINFTLPNISLLYYGQDSKMNHCINHYRYISDYVIVTDIDEVIVPQNKRKLLDIIREYGKENYVFIFESVQYLVKDTFSNIFVANEKGCIFNKGYEKMIIRPEKIISIGAHFPKVWQEKRNMTYVKLKDAYVRHARQMLKKRNCNIIFENKYISNLKISIEKYIQNIRM